MAIAFVQNTANGSESTSTGSYTVTASTTPTIGNTLIAVISSDGNTASQTTSIADSKGNVWTKDLEVNNTGEVQIWRAPVTATGAGIIFTIVYNAASSSNNSVVIQEFSNSVGALTKDQTATGTGTSISPTTAASSATTNANEVVIAGLAFKGATTTATAGSGYTNLALATPFVTGAGAVIESKVVSATGAQTGTFTLGASRAYAAGLVTYFETGSVTPTASVSTNLMMGV